MARLLSTDDGKYAFGDTEKLKAFLSIDGQCLGKTRKSRCDTRLARKTAVNIGGVLQRVHEAGFPSAIAASGLRSVAHKCLCKHLGRPKHSKIITGYGDNAKIISQEDDVYNEWNRRLWVAFLEANDVYWVRAHKTPPDLADQKDWGEQLRRLSDLPALGRRPSITMPDEPRTSSADGNAQSARKAARPDSPALGPPKRRSTVQAIGDHSRTIFQKVYPFSRPSASARQPVSTRPSLGRQDATQRVHTLAGKGRQEPPEYCEPQNGDDCKSGIMVIPSQTEDELVTPKKRQASTGDTRGGIQGLSDEHDASPSLSTPSTGPSPTFSKGDMNPDQTPITPYTPDDETVTTGKRLPTCMERESHQNNPAHTSLSPARNHQETRPTGSHYSSERLFGPDGKSAPAGANKYHLPIPMTIPTKSRPSDLGFRPGSKRQLSSDAGHEPDTPTKPRPRPSEVVPNSSDGEDGRSRPPPRHPDFEPYGKEDVKQYKALKKMLDILETRMHEKPRAPGYIYIFGRDSAPGFFKIGRSTEPFAHRAKEISYKCGYKEEVRPIKEWHMDVAVSAIERCVHCHLGEYRHWDKRCVRILEKNNGEGISEDKMTRKKKQPCDQSHIEWFNPPEARAMDVIELWHQFIQTRPFVNGRLNSFWRNEVVLVWDNVASWQKDGVPAFMRWEKVMRNALDRFGKVSEGDPMAELPLRLRVRSEGEGSVLEVIDETRSSDMPLLVIPMLSGQKPGGH